MKISLQKVTIPNKLRRLMVRPRLLRGWEELFVVLNRRPEEER